MTSVFDFITEVLMGSLKILFLIFFVIEMLAIFFGSRIRSLIRVTRVAEPMRDGVKLKKRIRVAPEKSPTHARVLDKLPTGELVVETIESRQATYVEPNPKIRVEIGDDVVIDDHQVIGAGSAASCSTAAHRRSHKAIRSGRACAIGNGKRRKKEA